MSTLLVKLVAGTAFGTALTASGVYSPWIIISQMKLADFHMLQVFLTASATSAIVILMAARLGLSHYKVQPPTSLRWFHSYDGNIIGGLILGFGMASAGACPGTVLVQIAMGLRSGYFAMAGAVLGGAVHIPAISDSSVVESRNVDEKKAFTVYDQFHMTEGKAVLYFELLCLGIVLSASLLTPGATDILVSPIKGGLLIGATQALSLAVTGDAISVSAAYRQLFQLLHWSANGLFGGKKSRGPLPKLDALAFAIGILGGSILMGRTFSMSMPGGDAPVSPLRAVMGGFAMVFGARLAGGCTSGHGISGMSTLSKASVVTVASIFAGGIALAALIN